VVFVVSPVTTVPAEGESLAVDGVVAGAVAPAALGLVEPGTVGPRVVEVVAALLYFVCCHFFSWRSVEQDLGGQPMVGVGLGKFDCAVVTAPLEFEEVATEFCGTTGHAVDFCVKGAVADNFRTEGVVLFQCQGVVDEPGVALPWIECELLFTGKHGTGVRIGAGMEGTGVDAAVTSAGE